MIEKTKGRRETETHRGFSPSSKGMLKELSKGLNKECARRDPCFVDPFNGQWPWSSIRDG